MLYIYAIYAIYICYIYAIGSVGRLHFSVTSRLYSSDTWDPSGMLLRINTLLKSHTHTHTYTHLLGLLYTTRTHKNSLVLIRMMLS